MNLEDNIVWIVTALLVKDDSPICPEAFSSWEKADAVRETLKTIRSVYRDVRVCSARLDGTVA